jgi:hypothetical protein
MGLLSIFKSTWSAGGMTQDDRKKVFWYLKRKTSYTAWSRAAAAFDDFSAIFKKQVVEQPHAPAPGFGPTKWDQKYVEILRAQVLFEQGLVTLRQGDRSVWRYNERGVLRDALMIGNSWFTELIYGGERGDHEFYGKYLDDLKVAIQKFNRAQLDVGYVQSMMSGTRAPLFWGEWIECTLNNEVYPRNPQYGFSQEKTGTPLVFPNPLPGIPDAVHDIQISTGDLVPADGIYEPQVKDGCMNYLLMETGAPSLAEAGAKSRPVVWKLIWEDVRYIDGQIPVEERLYFLPESAPQVTQSLLAPDVVSALSGDVCPVDGYWVVMDELDTRLELKCGAKMPQSHGREVTWVWVGK